MMANRQYPGVDWAAVKFSDLWIEREKCIYQNAQTVFVRSENIGKSLQYDYGIESEKVRWVGAGANVPIADGLRLRERSSEPVILFVGMDWVRKGGPELVEAFKRVREVVPTAKLRIVGCSPSVRLEGVTVLGTLSKVDVAAEMRQCWVFCLPSKLEPFGVVFVEAMLSGLPIVGCNVGAVPEIVGEGGLEWLVSSGDAAALANVLICLLEQPELREHLGRMNLGRAKSLYTWPVVASRMGVEIRSALRALEHK
jgi:glycosyltransferase involved in cell wall biosynthesis